jgi:hypothetical protein
MKKFPLGGQRNFGLPWPISTRAPTNWTIGAECIIFSSFR